MNAYRDEQPGTKRGLGLGAVIILHGLLIWAFASGLGTKALEVIKEPLKVALIQDSAPKLAEPPPPPPVIPPPPKAFVPPPEIKLTPVKAPPPKAITNVQQTVKEVPEAPPAPPKKTAPVADLSRGNTKPPYPTASIRRGEEGTVMLKLLVEADGDVSDGEIETSSGSKRLDRAALLHAVKKWHFSPTIENGVAVASYRLVPVTFRLSDIR